MSTSTSKNTDVHDNVPLEFICPITLQIMKKPMMTIWGKTFERAAILQWLETKSTCPITRQPLTLSDVVRNRSLEIEIKRWKEMNGDTNCDAHDCSKNSQSSARNERDEEDEEDEDEEKQEQESLEFNVNRLLELARSQGSNSLLIRNRANSSSSRPIFEVGPTDLMDLNTNFLLRVGSRINIESTTNSQSEGTNNSSNISDDGQDDYSSDSAADTEDEELQEDDIHASQVLQEPAFVARPPRSRPFFSRILLPVLGRTAVSQEA